jgi:hypothetical protein
VPWLDLRLEQSASGPTTLRGTVGPHPNWLGTVGQDPDAQRAVPMLAGFLGLIAVAGVAGFIYLLVQGDFSRLPIMLIPLGLAAVFVGVWVSGLRQLERGIPKLVQEVNDVLDSTATFTAP